MHLPYTVCQEEDDGHPAYVLEDPVARSEVWVAPDLGLNAYRFSVEIGDTGVAIIDPPPTREDLRRRPSGFGLPILFPYPGRVAQARFAFRDRAYELHSMRLGDHAIHGFVLDRPWQVIATGPSEHEGAVLVGRFESQAFPELAAQYPSHFRLDVTYSLRAWTLTIDARAENVGARLLPVGYGLHPYLRAPLDHGGSVGGCVIEVPVTRRWEVTSDLIPTGRLLPLEEDLPAGVSLEGRRFDDVYTGVLCSPGGSRCLLADTRHRLAVVVEADPTFPDWVVYTPPRPAVCFEPYTCVPNALNLERQGFDTGLIVLAPGESRSWRVRMEVKQL